MLYQNYINHYALNHVHICDNHKKPELTLMYEIVKASEDYNNQVKSEICCSDSLLVTANVKMFAMSSITPTT